MSSFILIIAAGLFDGLTPCSFATLIFFLSFIFFVCRTRSQVSVWGISFVAGVFAGLFLLNLGKCEGFRALEAFDIVSNAVYLLLAITAIVLGAINMLDWWRCRQSNDASRIILKIPTIEKSGKNNGNLLYWVGFVLFSVTLGVFLSVMSSSCVGQLYLPIMIEIFDSQGFRMRAIANLVLYNLMYVVPLIVSWLVIVFMFKRKRGLKFAYNHMSKFKVIAGGIFFGLGLGLLYMIS